MAYPQPYFNGYYPQQSYGYPNSGAMPDILNQQKMAYQQMPQQSLQPTQMSPTNDIIWVQGIGGAKSYLLAPNTTITLWDSENPTIYVKSTNAQGVPSMRILDFTERMPEDAPKSPVTHECKCGDKFATKADFEALRSDFEALRGKLEKTTKEIDE